MIGLAETYHAFDGNDLNAQTLPTEDSTAFSGLGDVLVEDQPAAQEMLVSIFGSSLITPTNPPPGVDGYPQAPPVRHPHDGGAGLGHDHADHHAAAVVRPHAVHAQLSRQRRLRSAAIVAAPRVGHR